MTTPATLAYLKNTPTTIAILHNYPTTLAHPMTTSAAWLSAVCKSTLIFLTPITNEIFEWAQAYRVSRDKK